MFGLINFGGVAGPVVGGVLYKMAGSGAVFGVAFALLMVDFAMRLAVIGLVLDLEEIHVLPASHST
jgi:hypothetical protein